MYDKDYLIIADYTSKFFDLHLLSDKTSPTVISYTKITFAKFGIPKKVMSDNSPEFASSEYKQFAKDWDFGHDTSSSEYPQSNGFIERTIQTMKSALKKALRNNEDPYLAILALRTTPQKIGMPSPATCLMNRNLRTVLPSFNADKKEKRGKPKNPKSSMLKQNYDQHAKEHKPLQPGATVRYRKHNTWSKKGRVVKKLSQPRSYQIETESGNIIRRNRRHLINTREPFVPRPRH